MAERQPGMTGVNLLRILESRLDNVVYRLGIAESRNQARQWVLHGHFDLNGQKATVPSMLVKAGDIISVRERSRSMTCFQGLADKLAQVSTSDWLQLDPQGLSGRVVSLPTREQIDAPLTEQLIVEYYSAR